MSDRSKATEKAKVPNLMALCRRHLAQTFGPQWEKTLLAPAARLAAAPPCRHRLDGRAQQIFHHLRHGGRYPAAAFRAYTEEVGNYDQVSRAMAQNPSEALSLASHWIAKVEWTLREAPLLGAGAKHDSEDDVSFHDSSSEASEGEEEEGDPYEKGEEQDQEDRGQAEAASERSRRLRALRQQRHQLEAQIEEGERNMRSLHALAVGRRREVGRVHRPGLLLRSSPPRPALQISTRGQLHRELASASAASAAEAAVATPPSLSRVLDIDDENHEPTFTLPVLDLTAG